VLSRMEFHNLESTNISKYLKLYESNIQSIKAKRMKKRFSITMIVWILKY